MVISDRTLRGALQLSLACLVVSWVSLFSSHDKASSTIIAAPKGLEFDFARPPVFVQPGGLEVFEVPVVNSSLRTCRILEVLPSCVCTKTELRKFELGPSEETTLRIETKMKDRSGPLRITIRMATDDPIHPNWTFGVSTIVNQVAEFTPRAVSLATIDAGSDQCADAMLMLCAKHGDPLPELLSLESDSPDILIAQISIEDESITGGMRRRVSLRLTASRLELKALGVHHVTASVLLNEDILKTTLDVLSTSSKGESNE